MEYSSLTSQVAIANKLRNIFIFLGLMAMISCIILGLIILKNEKIVVITPSIVTKEYELGTKTISNSYISDIARDIITLMLNMTPQNIQYIEDKILKIAHPSSYEIIQQQLTLIAQDISSNKSRSVFYPNLIEVETDNIKAIITGQYQVFLGTTVISTQLKKYVIEFDYSTSRLMIKSFYEVAADANS